MTGVHERIVLIMAGLLFSHPAFACRKPRVTFGVFKVLSIPSRAIKLSSAPLHVVGPGGFFVAVRRAVRIALLNAFLGPAQSIDFDPCAEASFRKRFFA